MDSETSYLHLNIDERVYVDDIKQASENKSEIKSLGAVKCSKDLIKINDVLLTDGVVKLKSVMKPDELEKLRLYIREHLYDTQHSETGFYTRSDTHTKHIVFEKGRCDIWPINDEELTIPPELNALFNMRMGDTYHKSSVGALLLDANTDHTGKWHRDTMPLFDFGNADINDAYTKTLPDFYFTVFIPLTKCTKDNGATEIILKSHRSDTGSKYLAMSVKSLAIAECDVGDLIIMNGKTVHRAKPNMTGENRDMLYIIYCARWYNEEKY